METSSSGQARRTFSEPLKLCGPGSRRMGSSKIRYGVTARYI